MPFMKELLQICNLASLKRCAYRCQLPYSVRSKAEIIDILLQGEDAPYILEALDKNSLINICHEYDLSPTGDKESLVFRIFEIVKPPKNTKGKAIRRSCMMCGHRYDSRTMEDHHFIPRSRTHDEGGTVKLCGHCHNVFHLRQREAEKDKGYKITDFDEIYDLFKRTKKSVMSGKYGRR